MKNETTETTTTKPTAKLPTAQPNGKLKAFYTVQEVAQNLRMSPRWVRDRVKDKDLSGVRLGNKIVVDAGSVERYLSECELQ